MKTIEIIEKKNISRLDAIGYSLAETYKIAFAGEPWNEVSRCNTEGCKVQFTAFDPGCLCEACSLPLAEAYSTDELVDAWGQMVTDEDASIEVSMNQNNAPILATIVRPTDPDELFERKYADAEGMRSWLRDELPPKFVWIEDTFANRLESPSGNLMNRGATLGRMAVRYNSLMIATRTLNTAVIGATLRDVGARTKLSLGSAPLNISSESLRLAKSIDAVPDRRTFMRIDMNGREL